MNGDAVTADDSVSGYPSHAHICAQNAYLEKASPAVTASPAECGLAMTTVPFTHPIASADRWGPFADSVDEAEHRTYLRSMRAIVHFCTSLRGDVLARHLRRAEGDPAHLPNALTSRAEAVPSVQVGQLEGRVSSTHLADREIGRRVDITALTVGSIQRSIEGTEG